MAFAQLTYRESLCDIKACLRAHQSKLYHMGIRSASVARNTLSKANERRDWRIYADFAQALIRIARPLYAEEDLGLELDNTVYALDASTIDLCLSVFPWALFRATKSAVKLHTLLDMRGNIPTFIHISDGKLHEVNVLDILPPEAGAFYIMDRGYVDFERLFTLHMAGAFFVIRARPLSAITASLPGAFSSKANACVISACSAPVNVNPMGLPSASTMPWILVPNPPRERPKACGPCFFSAGGVLVGADRSAIEHHFFQITIRTDDFEQTLPDTGFGPA